MNLVKVDQHSESREESMISLYPPSLPLQCFRLRNTHKHGYRGGEDSDASRIQVVCGLRGTLHNGGVVECHLALAALAAPAQVLWKCDSDECGTAYSKGWINYRVGPLRGNATKAIMTCYGRICPSGNASRTSSPSYLASPFSYTRSELTAPCISLSKRTPRHSCSQSRIQCASIATNR